MAVDVHIYITTALGILFTTIFGFLLYRQGRVDKVHDTLLSGLTQANITLAEVVTRLKQVEADVHDLTTRVNKHLENPSLHNIDKGKFI